MWSQCWNLSIPLQCCHGSWGTSGVSPGESVLLSSGGMHVRFPPELKQQCHASLYLDQGICGFPWRLSHEAFPRGFPTGLSHVPSRCESILGLKVEAVQGNRFPWNGLRHLGNSGNGGKTLEFLSPFLWLRLLLRCEGNAGNSFRITQGKDPSSRARRWKRGSSGYGRDSRASSRVERGISGNFLSCS